MSNLIPIIGPAPKTPEWEAVRFFDPTRKTPVIFGASEAAEVCGLSKYRTPLHVFKRKRRELPPQETTVFMKRGHRYEPAIIDEYREARPQWAVEAPRPMFFHPVHQFLAATPDATAWDGSFNGRPVDAKWIGWRRVAEFGDEGTDELPDDILMQAQQQMMVFGADYQETAVMLGGEDFRIYTVKKHEGLQAKILMAAKELAERIINNDPPEPNWSHPETPGLIKDLHGVSGETIQLSSETALIWSNYQRLKEEIKERENQAERLKARVLHVMEDASVGMLPHGEKCIVRRSVTVQPHARKGSTYIKVFEGDAGKWAKQ